MPRRLDPEYAVQVMLAAGLRPLDPFTRSNDQWRAECMTCRVVVTPIFNDVNRGKSRGDCACRGQRIGGKLRTPEREAVRTMQRWGWRRKEPYRGAGQQWRCECVKCRAIYQKKLSHVQDGVGGCRSCAGLDISDTTARANMLQRGLRPDDAVPYPGSSSPWPSTCLTCMQPVLAVTYARAMHRRSYCPTCWERRRGDALRLSPAQAVQRMRDALWEPLVPYPGSVEAPWLARCLQCSTDGTPRLHNVRSGARSCDTCAEHGIDLAKPGLLYCRLP